NDMTPSHNKASRSSIPPPNLTISPYRSHLLSVSADQVVAREGLPGICLILIHSTQHHVKRLCIGMPLSLPGWKRTSTRWTIVPTLTYIKIPTWICLVPIICCSVRDTTSTGATQCAPTWKRLSRTATTWHSSAATLAGGGSHSM